MSRSRIAFACILLLILPFFNPSGADDVPNLKSNQQDGQQAQQLRQQQQRPQAEHQQPDLVVELTPNLEQQLQQARRLNQRDSADEVPLAQAAYRYELVDPHANDMFAAGGGGGGDERPIVQTGDWFDHVQLGNNQKRRSGATGGASFSWVPGGSNSVRYSRGLPRYYHTKEDEAKYSAMPLLLGDQKEDKAYALEADIINNREGASRDSLWTSGLLRDLLIAQEAANRVRRLDELTRAALAERRLKAAGKINRSAANGRFNGIDFLETREKKRRCKVDPNLGVKNPSFCDTDAYFGAADYSMRDVWDSAGKR